MKKQKLNVKMLTLHKKTISTLKTDRIQAGEAWTEYAINCPYNSEVCTDILCPTNSCPATSNDTDGHSNQCNTTNPFTVVLF